MVRKGRADDVFAAAGKYIQVYETDADAMDGDGYLEEVFIHEGVHTALDRHHATRRAWCQAALADGVFISDHARNLVAYEEDLAETFSAWYAVRCRSNRLQADMASRIEENIPHRLAYLDAQNFNACS